MLRFRSQVVAITLIVLLSLSAACTRRMIDFTLISTKNVDLSQGVRFCRADGRTQGRDLVHIIIFIPTGQPNIKEAVDRAIEKVPGAVALLDGVVKYRWWWIPYLYGQSSFIVEGTALIDPRLVPEVHGNAYIITGVGEAGDVQLFEPINKKEYMKIRTTLFGAVN